MGQRLCLSLFETSPFWGCAFRRSSSKLPLLRKRGRAHSPPAPSKKEEADETHGDVDDFGDGGSDAPCGGGRGSLGRDGAGDGDPDPGQCAGTQSADQITGTDTRDIVFAKAGKDSVNAGRGNDKVYGGDGADTVSGFLGNDRVYGGVGNDTTVEGHVGDDYLYGGRGDDIIYDYPYSLGEPPDVDIVFDGPGDDYIDVKDGDGNDSLCTNDGETFDFSDPGDEVIGDQELCSLL